MFDVFLYQQVWFQVCKLKIVSSLHGSDSLLVNHVKGKVQLGVNAKTLNSFYTCWIFTYKNLTLSITTNRKVVSLEIKNIYIYCFKGKKINGFMK